MKKQKKMPEISEEWDLSQSMGILPADVPFTQNIGCVGGKKIKPASPNQIQENKN